MRRLCWELLLLAAIGTLSSLALGQDFELARQRGPYYVGEPFVVQVHARGFAAGDQVSCRLQGDPPRGVTVRGPQVGQSSRSYTQIINGRMTTRESVDFQFSFVITAEREGEFTLGPFEVTYGGESRILEGTSLQIGKLENDPDMRIACSLPRDSMYVGQEVPLTVRWSFAGELTAVQYAFANLQIQSPLFEQFAFKTAPRTSRTALTIATAKGDMEVDADVTQEDQNGKRYVVVTGTLYLQADTPGKFEDIPITCRTKKVTQWGRDFFGDRTARGTAPARATGEPLNFEIKPIPLAGRPPLFAGAVGSSFSIEVSANRSVVRVGDPISLTVAVRGDGNVEKISLPDLSAHGGLPPELFQVPAEPTPGTFDGQTKQFKVNVRVKDRHVTQIPPLSFAWFNPETEQFQTAQSRPIALQVMEAQVVTAADVVAAAPTASPVAAADDGGNGMRRTENPSTVPTFVGANLAIERDVTRLLDTSALATSPRTIVAILYALSAAAILVGVALRRRAQVDIESAGKRRRLKALRKRVAGAAHRPQREAADQVARAMRELIAQHAIRPREVAEGIIARSERIVFATGNEGDTDIADLVRQAIALMDEAARVP